MQQKKEELYQIIKHLKTKKEFEDEIKKRNNTYDDLLDEDTVALLIVDELGLNKASVCKINDLKADSDSVIIGTITSIFDPKTFTRKNGSSGKVVNLEISDDSGRCRLVLWDKDVDEVENNKIKIGSKIKIINGYTKDGYSGLEINLGRWGLLEILNDEDSKDKCITSNCINGVLVEKQPSKAFFKDSGEFGFVTKIKIKDENSEKMVTIWDDKVKEIQKYKIGCNIQLENITVKQNNGEIELHANGNCKIQKRK